MGRHKWPLIEGYVVQRIEADRMREVRGVEIDDAVLDAPGGRGIGDRRCQIAVRVQERKAVAPVRSASIRLCSRVDLPVPVLPMM